VLAEQSSIEMLSDNLNSLDRIDTINMIGTISERFRNLVHPGNPVCLCDFDGSKSLALNHE